MTFFKRYSFSALLFFVVIQSAFSQKDDKQQDVLADSIRKYFEIDSLKTRFFIDEYLLESIKDNDPKRTFRSYHILVMFYNEHYDQSKMIEYTDSLFSVAKKNDLKIELLKAYHLKNNNLRGTYGYGDERIFNNIFEARELAKEINNEMWESKFNQDISQYYMFTGQYEKSLTHYKNNLGRLKKLSKSDDYKEFKVWGGNLEAVYISIAELYIKLKQIDSAEIYNNYAKSILDTLESGYHELYKYRNMVNEVEVSLLKDNLKAAENNLNEALAIIPDYFRKSVSNFTKSYYSGMISYNKGDYENAIRHFESLDRVHIDEDENLGFYFYEEFYLKLYKSYLKINDFEKADYYFDKHLASINGKIDINNSANSNFNKIERDKYNNEVNKLKKQKSKQKYTIVLISLSSIFVIITTVILYRKRQNKDKKKLELLLTKISEEEKIIIKPKKTDHKIKDVEVERIILSLEHLQHKNYFLRTDCTAAGLAKKIKTNTTYLSKIINVHYQKNFTAYINDMRIDYVLDRLKHDKLFRRYAIQSISNEIGFKSKESFNSAFKSRTGVLPSALIRALEQKK